MKSKIKIVLYICLFISALVLLWFISDTYAVFETNSNGTANIPVGGWVIKLNSVDISSGQTVSFVVNNFNYSENAHIESGKIAPGRSGYFDVVLDPDGTDVSIRYDVTLDLEGDYEDNITYYVVTNGQSAIRTGENTYSGVIDLNDIDNGDVATLRIVVEWVNNSSYDDSDTELGLSNNPSISIPAEINVIQYFGETLVPYVSE